MPLYSILSPRVLFNLSNPEHVESEEETKLFESIQGGIIDVDAEDIVVIDEDIIEENENNIKMDESKEDKTDKEQQQ